MNSSYKRMNSVWGTAANTRKHRWGNLTLLAEWNEPLMADGPDGPYVADSVGETMWRLLCDCGHEFVIAKEEFPGRRIARNCNRPECPHVRVPVRAKSTRIGRPPTVNGSSYTVYLPNHQADRIKAYAASRGLNLSRAVGELAEEGLISKLIND